MAESLGLSDDEGHQCIGLLAMRIYQHLFDCWVRCHR
jgi:hypothetical protein